MDELIRKYAAELQAIYDNHTAGDHTFIGVLSQFAHEVHERQIRLYGVDNVPPFV